MGTWRAAGLAATLLAVASTGCPGPKGKGAVEAEEPAPPPFRGDGAPDLEDPLPPDPGQYGLSYLEAIYPALHDGWASFLADCRLRLPASDRLNDGSLIVALRWVVTRTGALRELEVASSSGHGDFDGAALEIVRDSAPFAPPPDPLLSDDDGVHILWRFAGDRRQAGVATAELTRVVWPAALAVPKFLESGNVTAAAQRLVQAATAPADPEAGAETDLVGLGKRVAVAAILEGLGGDAAEVHRAAVVAVGRAALAGAAPQVLSVLDRTADGAVRLAAIETLGRLGDPAAIAPLLAILKSGGPDGTGSTRRIAAAQALVALGAGDQARAVVVGGLAAATPAERLGALAVMARFGVPEAAPRLIEMVVGQNQSRATRQAACAALGVAAGAEGALKTLRKGLDASDAGVRAACAEAIAVAATLGFNAGRAGFWKLVILLEDRDDRVRAAAVVAAARVDPKGFAKELYQLRREKSPLVRGTLAEGLAGVPGPVAYQQLVELVGDADVVVRRAAAAALLQRPEKQGREVVARLIGDADRELQLLAVRAVDNPGDLTPYLEDESTEIRAAALSRLVAARGQRDTLVEAFDRIARAAAGSLERVRLADAWLQP